jgi:hypothetical protein
MPYTYYHERVPKIGFSETRSVFVNGDLVLPNDEYGFLELYCDDPACDCRRVVLFVSSRLTLPRVLATISYGWESPAFYEKTLRDKLLAMESSGASLDPYNEQSEYSVALLDVFINVVLTDEYEERLKRHYRMFKAALRKHDGKTGRQRKKRRGR